MGDRETLRRPLTREAIVAAAIAIADERGLAAVTMRAVGGALGVEAMSLYRHVPNKSALLDAAVESVWAAVSPPSPDTPWREGIRRIALSAHRELLAHPWVLDVIDASGGPPRFAMMDALLACLARGGLSEHDVYEGYHLVDALIIGCTLQQRNYTDTPASVIERQLASIPPDLSHLQEHIAQHEKPRAEPSGIELGIDLLLDALERRLPADDDPQLS